MMRPFRAMTVVVILAAGVPGTSAQPAPAPPSSQTALKAELPVLSTYRASAYGSWDIMSGAAAAPILDDAVRVGG